MFQNKLLKQLDNGSFEPKKIKKDKVYELLLSCRKTDNNLSERSIKDYRHITGSVRNAVYNRIWGVIR